jgi:hypothetical protein
MRVCPSLIVLKARLLFYVAGQAGQLVTDVRLPTFGSGNPVAMGPRRIVANVLLMAAFEIGDPIANFISMKADNFSWVTFGFVLRLHSHLLRATYRTFVSY